jgi:hypothetical protein
MCAAFAKAEAVLARNGRLDGYRTPLATGYFEIAKACYSFDARASFATYAKSLDRLVDKILDLDSACRATGESRVFLALQRVFGLRLAMQLLFRVRGATNLVRTELRKTFLFDLILRLRRVKIESEGERRATSRLLKPA